MRLEILRTIAEIEGVRGKWEELEWHPNSDIDFYQMVLSWGGQSVRPYICVLSRDSDGVDAMVVCRIEKTQFKNRLGYIVLMNTTTRQLSVVHGGVLGNLDRTGADKVVSAMLNSLRRGEADSAFFNHVKVGSPLYESALNLPSMFCRDFVSDRSDHWRARLSNGFEGFLQNLSSKSRYNLRRAEKIFEKAHSGDVVVRKFNDLKEVSALTSDAEAVAQTAYQRKLGAGFVNSKKMCDRLELMARRGWLKGYVLYAKGVPCAYWIATKYKGTVYLNMTGYNPKFGKHEVGTILFLKMIEDLCQDVAVESIDFGLGDASYKRRFGDENWEDSTVYVWAPTVKGVFLNMLRTGTRLGAQAAEGLLVRSGLRDRIKRLWRSKMQTNLSGNQVGIKTGDV